MTIGERIKARRIELGLSADEVAARLGKNRSTIYRYEGDEVENFPTTALEPLAKILETTPAHLMGWTDTVNEDQSDYRTDQDEQKIRQLMRKLEDIPFESRDKLIRNFEETLQMYIEISKKSK
ncbi:MAG: helix-turn-helix domain-containing protein [Ignavibacteriales bacterium]